MEYYKSLQVQSVDNIG